MGKCQWTARVEHEFDNAGVLNTELRGHVADCPECAGHLALLSALRRGAQSVARREEIRDPQFSAFMSGIRERVEAPRGVNRLGWWAWSSIGAAALIVSAFTFEVVGGGPAPVRAQTEIESVSTDLDGARIGDYQEEDGAKTVCTVWVNMPQGDVW